MLFCDKAFNMGVQIDTRQSVAPDMRSTLNKCEAVSCCKWAYILSLSKKIKKIPSCQM